ncbi:3-hydroxypropanoate dehydrogenase [Tistlia consotensis]|uniref:Putative NADH dehydrogenase/NAD(P)H nitroreductase SAMN05428998_13314 n=1 Tax=Tistlia consotensis USBA 355 TaxID=560819 RepID=A0A1Y6CSV6_9PROT|nr:malonic semialdehyde reductase [Tistlia consotensis]SMF74385.1 3-hydroxypropanoate dehydrogenase [Tistlia consotensis USBA 355]SNS10466.1 3-hydroxypropanoate dehydrogenase [Tistlia consotensis]
MDTTLDDAGLDLLFHKARTHNAWQDRPVEPALLHRLHALWKMPPTSANCSPQRVLFLISRDAKERLRPHLIPGNVDKTMRAPVTALLAYDLEYHEQLPKLFPHTDAKAWFDGDDKQELRRATAFRNGSLQGAYLILAARALGLDCGPMSGFDNAGVDAAFLAGTSWRSNFLCNLGYGDPDGLFPRSPRFDFDEVCRIL